jgi:hypothetical protein
MTGFVRQRHSFEQYLDLELDCTLELADVYRDPLGG